jgi:hypothetical protein
MDMSDDRVRVAVETNRIQEYLRAAAARGRDTEHIGPFLATFSRSSTNRFLNYAMPDDGARPSAGDVELLIEAYGRRGRRARLEYITAGAPDVEESLRNNQHRGSICVPQARHCRRDDGMALAHRL